MTGFAALPLAEHGGGGGGSSAHSPHLVGVAKVLGPRWLQLPALTLGLLGVQVFWSIEMSYATPYLISLGLSKAAVAIAFLAGPLSGLIVQPLIGVLADNSKSRFGRRRPYMLAGTCVCVTSMLLLGFTRPFATLFTPAGSIANHVLTISLAILALFSVDFSINAVQAVDRALLVDTLPPTDQADGNAWAARMLGLGSVAGYFIGNVDMTRLVPIPGATELEVLAVLGSFVLVAMHLVTALCTRERVVVGSKRSDKSFRKELRDIWDNARTLPSVIRQICTIQFFAWLGWFPVLFYTSAFIGDLHKRTSPLPPSDPALDAEATRLGSRALFYSSILSLAANLVLPFFVREAAGSQRLLQSKLGSAGTGKGRGSAWLRRLGRAKVSLAALWAVSHAVFAVCMGATFFYSSVGTAMVFTTLTGFSWSITQWAPFSLLAEAILTEGSSANEDASSIMLQDTRTRRASGDIALGGDEHERQFLVGDDEDDEDEDEDENVTLRDDERTRKEEEDRELEEEVRSFRSSASMDSSDEPGDRDGVRERRDAFMNNATARTSHLDVGMPDENDDTHEEGETRSGLAAKAGIIIGIHNIFIVTPQFVMTGIASIIFAILEPGKSALGHTGNIKVGNGTSGVDEAAGNATSMAVRSILQARDEEASLNNTPNSYAIVFR
ncbi:hypothetical protein AcW1_002427 [Taiwanofungus camphoratus]|nr:hypothetical protein AcW1_002427 [Antrodia cinnamomea]